MINNYPKLKPNIGRHGQMKMPSGEIRHYIIADEIIRTQSNAPHKKICLQKIHFENGRVELRLAYYIIGKKPRMKGKWVFGQYATLLPIKDFRAVVRLAKNKGWL